MIFMDFADSEGRGLVARQESLCILHPPKSSNIDSWTPNRVGRHPEWSPITSLTISEAGGTRGGPQIGFLKNHQK